MREEEKGEWRERDIKPNYSRANIYYYSSMSDIWVLQSSGLLGDKRLREPWPSSLQFCSTQY